MLHLRRLFSVEAKALMLSHYLHSCPGPCVIFSSDVIMLAFRAHLQSETVSVPSVVQTQDPLAPLLTKLTVAMTTTTDTAQDE